MKPAASKAQQPLERPVCGNGCTLLLGHTGKCTASNGKQWVKA